MKTWVIPVTWEVCGKVSVKANTLQEAMTIARDEAGEVPLLMNRIMLTGVGSCHLRMKRTYAAVLTTVKKMKERAKIGKESYLKY